MTRPALRSVLTGLAAILAFSSVPGTAHAGDPMIRYEVTGTPGMAEYLTYEIDYNQAHETNVGLPWSKQFSAGPGHTFLLSAQGHGTGSVTCRILVNGKVISEATASGQPARTMCAPSGG